MIFLKPDCHRGAPELTQTSDKLKQTSFHNKGKTRRQKAMRNRGNPKRTSTPMAFSPPQVLVGVLFLRLAPQSGDPACTHTDPGKRSQGCPNTEALAPRGRAPRGRTRSTNYRYLEKARCWGWCLCVSCKHAWGLAAHRHLGMLI